MQILPDITSLRWSVKSGVIALFGLLVLALTVKAIGGFYYHDGDDPVRQLVYSGYFTGVPEYVCNTFGGHILTGIIIQKLYIAYPGFEWYDAWMGASLGLAYLLGAYWLLSNISRYRIVAIALFSLIMASNFILVQITKTAFLLSFFALLNLLLPHRKISVLGFLLFYSAFFLGLCTRFDTGFLAAGLALPVCIIARIGELKKSALGITLIYLMLVPSLGFIYYTVNNPTTDADKLWSAIRPYSFTLVDWRETTDINCPVYSKYCTDYSNYCPKTNADSLTLMALQNHFFFDKSFDVKKLDELCVVPKDKMLVDLISYFNRGSSIGEKFQKAMKSISSIYIAWVLAFALLIIFTLFFHKKKPNANKKILLTVFLFLITIIVIAAVMKIVDRLMVPMLQSLLIIILYYWVSLSEKITSLIVCIALVLSVCAFSMINVVKRVQKIESDSAQLTALYKELNRLPDGSIVCFDVRTPGFLHPRLFEKFNLKPSLIPYSFDYGFLFAYPSWQRRTKELFGDANFSHLVKNKFHSENHETYFVFYKQRYQFFNQLSKGLYDTDITFYPVFIFPVRINTSNPPYTDFQLFNIK